MATARQRSTVSASRQQHGRQGRSCSRRGNDEHHALGNGERCRGRGRCTVCITSFPQETIAGLGRGRGRTPETDGKGKVKGVQCRMGATYDWYPCIASATARLCLRCVSESESIDGMRRTPSRCRSRSWS